MITKCPKCGERVLSASMTEDEEQRYAAAFQCTNCKARFVEMWPEGRSTVVVHVAIEEK